MLKSNTKSYKIKYKIYIYNYSIIDLLYLISNDIKLNIQYKYVIINFLIFKAYILAKSTRGKYNKTKTNSYSIIAKLLI